MPHFPLQAPAEDIARYRERYRHGWDAMRDERWARMQKLGLVAGGLSAVERNVGPPYAFADVLQKIGPGEVNRALPWTELTDVQRALQIDKMAIYAAMIDRMDRETGRVLDQIRAMGALENTIVFFLSDNGSSAEMMIRGDGHDPEAAHGSASTFLTLGPGWSRWPTRPSAGTRRGRMRAASPRRWSCSGRKASPRTASCGPRPGISSTSCRRFWNWPAGGVPELAGGPPPPGRSLVPAFAKDVVIPHDSLWWMHEGNRALRVGDWKIVALKTGPWEMYDLSKDRAESHDFAAEKPEKLRELAEVWEKQWTQYQADAKSDLPTAREEK